MSTENTPSSSSSSSSSSEKKLFELKSSDGQNFQVEEKVAIQSVTIKNVIEDDFGDSIIPIPNVTGVILAKVIEYCKRHVDTKDAKEDDIKELKEFDAEFVKVDQDVLFDLVLAANYLNIVGLLDLTCQTIADMMKGKKPEEIREIFHIVNDYTPEEEAEIRRENAWAFE